MAFQRRPPRQRLVKMGGVSLGLHIGFVAVLSLSPWPMIIKAHPVAYTVTLMPIPIQEPDVKTKELPPPPRQESPKIIEKTKPAEKIKKDDIVERAKKIPPKEEKPKRDSESLKHLQEALEEIRRKVALDEIQKKVARRDRTEEPPPSSPPSVPLTSPVRTPPGLESIKNEYYSLIWAKIKEAWTIPENLLKETVDLETIIVIRIERDGRIQKSWFEKKSGNSLYDQTAMRAIRKADPLPPLPKEFGESTLEIGIRFFPD